MTTPFRQLLKFLESDNYDIEFRWIDKNTFALIDFPRNRISINLDLAVVHFFVHEFLHDKYPELKEKEIEKKTGLFVDRMTVKEIQRSAKEILNKALIVE